MPVHHRVTRPEAGFARFVPGSAGVPPARAEGPQWTTRTRPTMVDAGGTPAPPGNPPFGSVHPLTFRGKASLHGGTLR